MEDQYAAQLNEARNQTNFRQEEVGDDVLVDGEALTEDELNELRITPPAEPLFPIFIFGLAVIKDLFDIFSAGFFGWLASIIIGGIIWLWLFGKIGIARKYLLRRLVWPFMISMFVGFIPWLNFVPEAIIFVLLAHYRETKIVKQFFKALEQIEKVVKYA